MQYIEQLINWLRIHPDYALMMTFLVSCAESVIFIGGLIPGSLALSAIGILAGSGVIAIYPPLGMAILGAIVGDTLSFFIGRIFKSNLRKFFIFKRYPQTLEYAQSYFEKHGGKSVFLARFIGPIRAMVPAIAGMMGLSRTTFIIANSSSAIGWSALFYFPGVLIGMGHEQIREHFSQIMYAILALLVVPMVSIKLWRYLKLKYYRRTSQYFNKIWQAAFNRYQLIRIISPKQTLCSYHSTAFEYLLTLLLGILFLASFFIKHRFLPPIWLQDQNIANLVYAYSLYANNLFHCCMLSLLFILFCLYEQKTIWLKSLALLVLTLFALDNCILSPTTPVSRAMILYSYNAATLFFWARLLLHFKSKAGFYFEIFIFAFLISSQYILNIHYHFVMFSYLTAGLLAGQVGWLHARKISFYISNSHVWSIIIIGLISFELCFMHLLFSC